MQNNTTLDQTDDFFFPPESQSSLICKSVAVAIVAMVAIVGNFLVVHTVWTNQRMQTATNYLIVNMAIADLLYMVLVIPPTFIVIYGSYEWPFRYSGRAIYFCQVVHFGQYLLVPVSVLTLATIATDRFFAITMPMKRLFTKKVYRSLMVVIWLVAAGLAAPILYAYRIKEFSGMLYCDEDWSPAFDTTRASRVYTIFLFAVAYCVPFVVMSVMYSVICRQLWMRKIPGEQDIEKSKKALESRKKVVKMLITVVVCFVLCWLPVQVATFLWDYSGVEISVDLNFILMFLMRSHSAVSPCIYAIFSQNYRQGFKKSLCCGHFIGEGGREEFSASYNSHTQEALLKTKSGRKRSPSVDWDNKASYHRRNGKYNQRPNCRDLSLPNYDQLKTGVATRV